MADPNAQRNFLALKQKSYAIKFDLENTDYTPIENIGTGAYGVVCSAVNNKTKGKVAIKKIPSIFEQRTIAKRTYREIKILKHFTHDNIIAIQEILHPRVPLDQFKDIYIVLDLMESDLHRIIHSSQPLTEEHVRFFTYQILRGLKYVHSANVVHRDLKPSNLLVNENCDLKIGDFGMARGISNNMEEYSMVMTQYVATRWYRAPELMILPKETYTEAVDMWSVGCILAEMIGRKQLFPGKSHIDQIERIVDKLGTPSSDYLKLTSSPLITSIIMNKGHLKAIDWKDVYPKATKKALDLLGKMLILDPKKRITVHQALKHPFVNKYHDPDDEPICLPIFNFDFERENPSTQNLKDAIIEEIMEYHKPKPKLRPMQFNFRPVPKSELVESPPAKQFDFKPVLKSELDEGMKQSTNNTDLKPSTLPATGIDAFLQCQNVKSEERLLSEIKGGKAQSRLFSEDNRSTSQSSSDGSKSDGSFERKHSQLVEDLRKLQALQGPAFTEIDSQNSFLGSKMAGTTDCGAVFKKPEGVPLLVKVKDSSKAAEVMTKYSSDIEMCSARSTSKSESGQGLLVETKQGESIDVEMPSAQSTGQDQSQDTHVSEDTVEVKKPIDTKELIRMALLNNKRRVQKEAIASKPKPVTALQRQREREERKRQKIEKAKQKQKKSKDKSAKLELTDEDKKLLAKWQGMQKSTRTDEGDNVPASVPSREGSPATRRALNNSQINPEGNTQPPVSTEPTVNQPVTLDEESTSSLVTVPSVAISGQGIISHNDNARTTSCVSQNSSISLVSRNVTAGLGTPVVSFSQQPADPQGVLHAGVLSEAPVTQASTVPFGTYSWPNQRVPEVVNELNPSVHIGAAVSKLPTYTEALEAKSGHADTPWSNFTGNTNIHTANPLLCQGSVTGTQGQGHLNDPHWLAGMSAVHPPNLQASGSSTQAVSRSSTKDENDMRIITKQLKQSNVEDLVLTNTPKGTGGGYGIASDFDLFMDIATTDKPDSAQLSPSLFTDWQELTGNIDPCEFESVLHEINMMSPVSSQEINNVMISLMSPKNSNKVS